MCYYRLRKMPPQIFIVPLIAAMCLLSAGWAFGSDGGNSIYPVLQGVLLLAGVASLIIGIGWGLINRKNYDKLNETINDLEKANKSKQERLDELQLKLAAHEARWTGEIQQLQTRVEALRVSNEAVVSQNLQMKAILKGLRMQGVWAGHEDDVFTVSGEKK